MKKLKRINLVACGTAFFSAKLGAKYIRDLSDINVEAFRSSEFPASRVSGDNTLTIGISQSGETKDTFDALQSTKICGGDIASVCNVIGSTIARFTGNGAYLYAGPEYSVASTKAFTNMSAIQLLLAVSLSEDKKRRSSIIGQLRRVPSMMTSQLLDKDGVLDLAVDMLNSAEKGNFYWKRIFSTSGRGRCTEDDGSHVSSLSSYPAGELKHGPIALIESGTPVIAVAPSDEIWD